MRKNKELAAFLAGVLLISFAGCAKNSNDIGNSSQAAESAVQDTAEPGSKQSVNYQARLDKAVRHHNFDGVVYITQNGSELCKSAAGKAGPEGSGDITEDSLFCIGSISKQFAAASILMLRDEGKLSVDDTLEMYFPEYVIGKDITVKNLLTMRSGIPDYSAKADDNDEEYTDGEYEAGFSVYEESDAYDNQLALKEWLFNEPLDFEPDTGFEYSNSNYLILSMIVEQVSGREYHTYVRENIFNPLGMESSCFIEDRKTAQSIAEGMEPLGMAGYPGVSNGAGDIISNAKDMDIWLTSLRENKLLSPASFTEMATNYSEDQSVGYGYGLMLPTAGGVMHTGRIGTYVSAAYTNPKNGYNLFAVSNNAAALDGDIDSMLNELLTDTMDQ